MRKVIALLLVSCASRSTPTSDPSDLSADFPDERAPVAQVTARVTAPAKAGDDAGLTPPRSESTASLIATSIYPPHIRSVRLRKRTALRKDPSEGAPIVGIIKKDALAGVLRALPGGQDCQHDDGFEGRWIELAPRGWTCESALEPSTESPPVQTAGSLREEDEHAEAPPVRGVYGIVRKKSAALAFTSPEDALAQQNGRALEGSNTVRARNKVTLDGRRYWRTTKGELIDASAIVHLSPSRFKGELIEAPADLPAWVRSHRGQREPVVTRALASARSKVTGKLAPRTVVTILEESADGRFVRVADSAWIARADLRRATLAEPPPGTRVDERWFDIDLEEQVLVAYEGPRPVYATLVSTGKRKHRTPSVIARVVSKLEHAVMSSEKESYTVADVPWTMYYDHDYALHTSYWHDGFGGPRSHGCINLAPRDARLLYRWSSPDVPPGWSAVYGDEHTPGSLVRVRSRKVPSPAFRGYARTLHQQRTSGLDLALAP